MYQCQLKHLFEEYVIIVCLRPDQCLRFSWGSEPRVETLYGLFFIDLFLYWTGYSNSSCIRKKCEVKFTPALLVRILPSHFITPGRSNHSFFFVDVVESHRSLKNNLSYLVHKGMIGRRSVNLIKLYSLYLETHTLAGLIYYLIFWD